MAKLLDLIKLANQSRNKQNHRTASGTKQARKLMAQTTKIPEGQGTDASDSSNTRRLNGKRDI